MNIGIITFYYKNDNFGGVLQAYALPTAINQFFFATHCEQIQYDYRNREHRNLKETWIKLVVKKIVYLPFKAKARSGLKKRKEAFELFRQSIPHSKAVYTDINIQEVQNLYDVFICGGDQIWNDWGENCTTEAFEQFVLKFAKGKKISYAPSIGNNQLSHNKYKTLAVRLQDFSAVSVRERSAKYSLQPYIDRDIQVVLDPVLLLESREWDKIATKSQARKYALAYFLGTDKENRQATQKYAKRCVLKTYVFPYINGNVINKSDLFFGDIRDFTSGPAEFVGLIKSAECVITDSFHAIVFSLIYHKPFYVFERNTQVGGGTMNSRIHDFLEEFGLQDRLVTPEQLEKKKTIEPIDYTYADKVLARRRKESYDYLKTALGIQNEV